MIGAVLTVKQRELREEARAFVREAVPRDLLLDMEAERVRYPRQFLEEAGRRRLLGLRFPKEQGGRGLDWASEIVVLEEVGVLGSSLACLYSLPSIIGEALNAFGTEKQKEKYLKPMLEGRLTAAEALTEPRSGSDFFGLTTSARREGDVYLLNGQKRFIVGAEGADIFLVYARTSPDEKSRRAISTFIVERGPGIEVEHVYGLMGTRGGGTGRIRFRDAPVPAENLIGEENGGAEVFYRMMVPERMTTAAGAVGLARAALEIAAGYSDRRHAFGKRIREFEGVSFRIAESITKLDAARGLVYLTALTIDGGDEPGRVRRLVSEAKKFATEAAWEVINHAMQVMGGIGYTNVYPVERLLRDARLMLIWTGTNEIMNLIIQHEYYKEVLGEREGLRDVEADAAEADRAEEKVYE
ncbi:MAG: acyl-CoA dehydrogenase family protein [Candidatus Bipolaricaulia bacterium]